MKKLILIVAFFISQVGFGQYYTFQVFANMEEIFGSEDQLVEPFRSFLAEHGVFYPDTAGPGIVFDDDPGDYIFPMYVVPEQANALEDLLINSDVVYKFIRHNGETEFVLDRLYIKYFNDQIPEFLGMQNGIVQTDIEALNLVFEEFQVDNYAQSLPSSTNPNLLSVHQIRCSECDIFQLFQEIIAIEIVELAELVEYEYVLNIIDLEETSGFTLSPNPNNGNFEISLKSNELTGTSFTIFDTFGRKIYEEKSLQTNTSIQLNGIPSGVYFARFDANGKNSVKKFIVKN